MFIADSDLEARVELEEEVLVGSVKEVLHGASSDVPVFCFRCCADFSISRNTSREAIVGSPSSKIFLNRRC